MADAIKWYEQDVLPTCKLEELLKEGSYRPMHELSPSHNEAEKVAMVGDKVAVLLNNGLVGYYTITALRDIDGTHIVGRDETGITIKGQEFAIDSSMGWCQARGYKVLEKFPWE